MATHLAAICRGKDQPFVVERRPTPTPGPGELLIAVKSVALNPADRYMRDQGIYIPSYPTVIGFDMAGVVLAVGENTPNGSTDDCSISFQPGVTRVAAYAAFFWKSFSPNYGAFQECCIVPWQHAVPLPDSVSWNQAVTFPVAVEVPLCAWDSMGIPRLGEASATTLSPDPYTGSSDGSKHSVKPREALLIWGASSSVGTMGVQSARLLQQDPSSYIAAVYATAGLANKTYIASLGADRVFDYKDDHVVDEIVLAARKDGLVIRHCFLAKGNLQECQAVLKASLEDNRCTIAKGKIGSAPMIPPDAKVVDGVETIFLQPSTDEEVRLEQFRYWMGTWLKMNLAEGLIRPSPEYTVVGNGLEAINVGLDRLLEGVSCTKLVVEIEK